MLTTDYFTWKTCLEGLVLQHEQRDLVLVQSAIRSQTTIEQGLFGVFFEDTEIGWIDIDSIGNDERRTERAAILDALDEIENRKIL